MRGTASPRPRPKHTVNARGVREGFGGLGEGVEAGVAGAHLPAVVVLLLGFANLLADGLSMGASNYLGTRSEQQVNGEAHRTGQRRDAIEHGTATFIAFLVAGLIPLLAFVLPVAPESAFTVAVVLTGIALFTVGASRSLLIPRAWWRTGLEMFIIGMLAALAAYLAGWGVSQLVGYTP